MAEEVALFPPAAKRVRWDDSVVEGSHSQVEREASRPPGVLQQSVGRLCACANDAIRLLSVSADAEQCGQRGAEYKPEFTHQLFDKERIEGYADGEVTIRVLYSATSLHFLVKINTSDADATREAEILSKLSKALPPKGDYSTDESEFMQLLEERQKDFKPPGTRVHEYKRGKKPFAVYRSTGEDPGAQEYHHRSQSLAPWFIETADRVDLNDDRWEVFYLFEEEVSREVLGEKWRPAAFVGYFTVFGFRNPVKGVSLRVCQALLLPQYQRQGHGQALLTFLYDVARAREGVFEITAEDPAPGFEKLRNLVDARVLRDHNVFPKNLLSAGTFQRPSKETVQEAHKAVKLTVSQVEIGFDVLKARDVPAPATPVTSIVTTATTRDTAPEPCPNNATNAADASATAAIKPTTPETAHGEGMPPGANADEGEEKRKPYRLMVKRRLLKRYGEELATDAPTRKRQLEELYRQVEGVYLSLGAKLKAEEEGKVPERS